MIALNFGARFFAILLIFFVAATIFYFHDFWNQIAAGQCQDPGGRAEKPVDHRRAVHDRGLRPGAADSRARLWRCLRLARRHGVTLTSLAGSRICGFAGFQAVRGQNLLRRSRGHAGEAGLAARQPHMRRLRQPERVVAVHEHSEHVGSADDRDGAGAHAGVIAGGLERGAGRIPQRGFGIGRIGRDARRPSGSG